MSRIIALTALAMIAFAGNSLLCRIALRETSIDPASFTTIRIAAGAITLYLVVRMRAPAAGHGNWPSAIALLVYAAGFSFAYLSLTAATGALLLFGAVQGTMIGHGLWGGERFSSWQLVGLVLAVVGLLGLLLPGIAAPPLAGSLLMLLAGIAWGIYSLRGRGAGDPTTVTAGNFLRAAAICLPLSVLLISAPLMSSSTGDAAPLHATFDRLGVLCAVTSGAITSGLGYAIWYSVLPSLRATTAATVQLSVPPLAALGGVLFLSEPLTLRLIVSSLAILGGIGLVLRKK